jgi:mevalonate pyrophosphate decarboxylase
VKARRRPSRAMNIALVKYWGKRDAALNLLAPRSLC